MATGADLTIVQDLLGHSSITITADTYAHVLPELARDTAEATTRLIPAPDIQPKNPTVLRTAITISNQPRKINK